METVAVAIDHLYEALAAFENLEGEEWGRLSPFAIRLADLIFEIKKEIANP